MTNIEKINGLLSKAGFYFLATVDGDIPKVRPLGLNFIHDNKIYFGVGSHKEMYSQMQKNPNVEISGFCNGIALRYSGKSVFVNDDSIVEKAFEIMPDLKKVYNQETGYVMAMFYLENGSAQIIENFTGIQVLEV